LKDPKTLFGLGTGLGSIVAPVGAIEDKLPFLFLMKLWGPLLPPIIPGEGEFLSSKLKG
jgi:hypothetical protein